MLPSIVRCVNRDDALLSDEWVTRAPAPISLLSPPRRSLQHNCLDIKAKQAIKDAAGSGISIIF